MPDDGTIGYPLLGISQRLPPSNIMAEQGLLGAILANNKALDRCDFLSGRHFADPIHGRIFEAIARRVAAGQLVDTVTLKAEFENAGILDAVGGPPYLAQLQGAMVAPGMSAEYAKAVHDCWLRRQLIDIGENAVHDGFGADPARDGQAAITATVEQLLSLGENAIRASGGAFGDAVDKAISQAERAYKGDPDSKPLTCGIASLDKLWGGIIPGEQYYIVARSRTGKAQPLDSRVLRADGRWARMGELSVGDSLASVDGAPSVVDRIFPQGEMQAYTVTFSDRRQTEATADHLWRVYCAEWGEPRLMTTAHIGVMMRQSHYRKRLYVDEIAGEFGTDEGLQLDPYVLGCLLGDGDISSITPRLTCADTSIVAEITRRLEGTAEVRKNLRDDISYSFITTTKEVGSRPNIRRWKRCIPDALRALGLLGSVSETKFVPQQYLAASRESRLWLLRGLMDTDGWVSHGNAGYSSCSKALAEGVRDLIRSLGGHCWITFKRPTYNYKGAKKSGQLQFVCRIRHRCLADIFFLPRKKQAAARTERPATRLTFRSIEPVRRVPVQCIRVSHFSQLYVTDDYIVTHNTPMMMQVVRHVASVLKARGQGEHCLVFSLEMPAEGLATGSLASLTGFSADDIRRGNLNDDQWNMLRVARKQLADLPIIIEDAAGMTRSEITMRARSLARQKKVKLVAFDHRDLFGRDREDNRMPLMEWLPSVTRGTKQLCKAIGAAGLMLIQLNKDVEAREDSRPRLGDLPYSGEQDADAILAIHRAELYMGNSPPPFPGTAEKQAEKIAAWHATRKAAEGVAEVSFLKRRFGPTGWAKLRFDGPRMLFSDPPAPEVDLLDIPSATGEDDYG